MEMLLSLRNLKVGLHNRSDAIELVRGIDLDVGVGEIVALVGESGSGKSLSALSVARLLPAGLSILEGEVKFNGVDLVSMSDKEMQHLRGREIGMIFQDPLNALNPTLTVGKQLTNAVRSRTKCTRRSAHETAVEALRAVGISQPEQRMSAFPHEMSGGMRQRVMIALVLLGSPKLIFADEPTTALDVTVQARIVDLLHKLRSQTSTAIVFISHNLDLVTEFCDRVVVMYGGRIMEQGTSEQIVSSPRHPYTSALLACIPRLDASPGPLHVIPGRAPDNPGSIVGCPFAERCTRAISPCLTMFPELSHAGHGHTFYCFNPEPVTESQRA